MLLNRAKQAVEKKEVQMRGSAWLAEVHNDNDDDATWKSLEEWAALYEPKKEKKPDSERRKAAKAKVAAKAKEVVLEKINKSVSKKLFLILLEISSTVLTKAESQLCQDPVLSKLLNNVNAIILSYRFESKSKTPRKFAYMRNVATDHLADALEPLLRKDFTPLLGKIRVTVGSLQTDVQVLVSNHVDLLLNTASTKVDETVENKLAEVDEKLAHVQVGLSAAGVAPPPTEDVKSAALKQGKDTKDDLVATFGVMFKDVLIGKMETLTDTIVKLIRMLVEKADAIFAQYNKKRDEKIHEEMHQLVEDMYASAVKQVADEVRKIVDMMAAIMDAGDDDEDEEEL